MSNYGENKKQICFESTPKLHADLKIRLHYDEIKIKDFFNKILMGYINKNKNIMAFVDEIKETKGVSQTRRNKTKKSKQKQENIIRQFALDKTEIEDIFDILEKEHPDL
jgi:glycerol-3-phosphate responsive antiterminator